MPLRYSHAPRPTSAPITFALEGQTLTVDSGRKVDIVQLGAVEQLRLTYEPRSFAQRAYQTQVRMRDGKTFKFSSLNWKSMIQATNQGPEYSAFVRALSQAVAGANPQARFLSGRPLPVWAATVVLTVGSMAAIVFFIWRALQADAHGAAGMGAVLAFVGIWQLEPMVRLNRPKEFGPHNPPKSLLP